jgi:hypothetical protein
LRSREPVALGLRSWVRDANERIVGKARLERTQASRSEIRHQTNFDKSQDLEKVLFGRVVKIRRGQTIGTLNKERYYMRRKRGVDTREREEDFMLFFKGAAFGLDCWLSWVLGLATESARLAEVRGGREPLQPSCMPFAAARHVTLDAGRVRTGMPAFARDHAKLRYFGCRKVMIGVRASEVREELRDVSLAEEAVRDDVRAPCVRCARRASDGTRSVGRHSIFYFRGGRGGSDVCSVGA